MGSLMEELSRDIYSKTGMPAATAEKVMREFWNTVQEALINEGTVKVKGLGTFKMIEVKDRESINVNNGERIVIKGYKKVSFSPDPTFNIHQVAQSDVVEELDNNVADDSTEEDADELSEKAMDKLLELETLTNDEQDSPEDDDYDTEEGLKVVTDDNQDEFGGIDLLIPTPESIADAEREYEEAKNELENAMTLLEEKEENYRKVQRKLKFLLTGKVPKREMPNLNEQTESTETGQAEIDIPDGDNSAVDNPEVLTASVETEEDIPVSLPLANLPEGNTDRKDNHHDDIPASPTSEKEVDEKNEIRKKLRREEREERRNIYYTQRNLWRFLIAVLICVVGFFIYMLSNTNDEGKETNEGVDAEVIVEKKKQPSVNKDKQQEQPAESLKDAETTGKTEKEPADKTNPQQQKRPDVYILQKGESLTDVSLMFYGTKDSVMAIIRNNNFRNPDVVYVGMEIKLP